MGNTDTDIITTADPPESKSLLEKYKIPVENLSYEYISECKKPKELERIVLILRSGQEGYYPDLTRHAEERLAILKPDSTILRVACPALTRITLDSEVRQKLEKDIDNWTSEMRNREKDLEEGKSLQAQELPYPEIRHVKEATKSSQTRIKQDKRIASCDYAAWDMYDADTEINRIDLKEEQKRAELKRIQQKQRDEEEKHKKLSKEAVINKVALTGTELTVMAEQEREKGNEAFRSGDYKEALQLYNSCIVMDPSPNAYNNRAITYIKLKSYEKAVEDCNRVLSIEYTNIKALLRRGLCMEYLRKEKQALADYEAVLKLESCNQTAIKAISKLREPCESKKIRMKINELVEEKDPTEDKNKDEGCQHSNAKNSGEIPYPSTKLINNMKTTPDNKSADKTNEVSVHSYNLTSAGFYANDEKVSKLCFCDRAPGSSQNTKPLPHFKNNYCVTSMSDTILNKGIIPSATREALSTHCIGVSSVTKQSGVTIEEIPSEPCIGTLKTRSKKIENPETDERKNVKGQFVRNEAIKIKKGEGDEKGAQDIHDKKDKVLSERRVNKDETNFFMKPNSNDTFIPRKIEVASKYEKPVSKAEKGVITGIDNVESPYEFIRTWQALKNNSDLSLHAQVLRATVPEDLNTVIGNKLDGSMFSEIIRCVEQHFCFPEDVQLVVRFLKSLSQLSRFSIVSMFMDSNDKKVLQNTFAFLESQRATGISVLRQVYNV
ncbi:sperm-associated antigen 1 [Orussus abietinus]|uniref:sperm-associated antigen 1 n=1 Tax=Orussus abietinus TaxID=222816 RepID=UPI00062574DA|nr:sperm-associated antigen 1 [Orussus abietinus]